MFDSRAKQAAAQPVSSADVGPAAFVRGAGTSGYPAQWEHAACTRDGVAFRIRPIRPDDLERDRRFIINLSTPSRYHRLMGAVREPPPALLERFVHVDYRDSMAFVAVTGESEDERIIGVARYAGTAKEDGSCEFAVAVADAWQSRGVGTILMRVLFEYARSQGFNRVFGLVLSGNQRMLKLAEFLGMQTQHCDRDGMLVEASRHL